MEYLDSLDLTPYAWLVGVCFSVAFVLIMILIIMGVTNLVRFITNRWRTSVWETAARMLAENQREVENYVAKQELDAVEYREFELRPVELPAFDRLDDLTKDEAIEGMLAHAGHEVQQAVVIAGLRAEINHLNEQLASKERARARHWATIQRLKRQLPPRELGGASSPKSITQETEKHHHEETR